MAEAWFKHRLEAQGVTHIRVSSAGLLGIEDAPAAEHAVTVLKDRGVDLSSHKSRGLTGEILTESDLTIVMSLKQLGEIQRRWPGHKGVVHLIRAFEKSPEPESGAPDVEDPMGKDLDAFKDTFKILEPSIEHLLILLRHLS